MGVWLRFCKCRIYFREASVDCDLAAGEPDSPCI